jgi:K+-sensing histidine kinase KdpD
MEHVYTPEEFLSLEHLQQELKQIEIDSNPFPNKRPKAVIVNSILAYSNALEVKHLKKFGKIEQILN